MDINNFLDQNKIPYLENEPLAKHTYYKIGGLARWLVKPNNIDQTILMVKTLSDLHIKSYVLGEGANVLFSDTNFNGVVINFSNIRNISILNHIITAEAGINLQIFVDFCIENNLHGYAQLSGIPGSLGGALKMNAGAFGVEIYDHLTNLLILDYSGKTKLINKADIKSGYRKSGIDSKTIILNASFKLKAGSKNELIKIKKDTIDKRHLKQPWDLPSCGSVFKKVELQKKIQKPKIEIEITDDFKKWQGIPAGFLIEKVGLKGKKIGGAQISPKHANFIVNTKNASAKDVLALMNLVRKEVYTKTGYILEPEVQLVGLKLEVI